jgi:hypothetical protein
VFEFSGERVCAEDVVSVGVLHQAVLTIENTTQFFSLETGVITCLATLNISGEPSLSANVSFQPGVVFDNITITPAEVTENSTEGLDQSGAVNLTCSLTFRPATLNLMFSINITWTREEEGAEEVVLNGTTPVLRNGLLESELTVFLPEVMGVVLFACTATLDQDVAVTIATNTTITHNCKWHA